MSRQLEPDRDPEDDKGTEPSGHIGTTGIGPLVLFGLGGLVLGWLLRPVSIGVNGVAPTVGWLPVLALFFVALVVGSVAWSTYRSFHKQRERIEPHRAVNRLVLAKSCALGKSVV